MNKLKNIVKDDVSEFLRNLKDLLFNERELQIRLAVYLMETGHYDDVFVEYYVPKDVLGSSYIWNSQLYLDVVVRKNEEFFPIELKYKTKEITVDLPRLGETLSNTIVVKNQGAQDLGMYDFWKDIRRIEMVCNRFQAVNNGMAVFLSNDDKYTRKGKETSNHILFDMTEGVHSIQKHWLNENAKSAKGRRSFDVTQCYSINWNSNIIEDNRFYYCIVEI